jgi:hypothetical protein
MHHVVLSVLYGSSFVCVCVFCMLFFCSCIVTCVVCLYYLTLMLGSVPCVTKNEYIVSIHIIIIFM